MIIFVEQAMSVMRTFSILSVAFSLVIGISSCHSDYCTVKGTAKGLADGKKLQMQDAWGHYKVIASSVVKDGAFEFHPNISAPTHVYLYQDNTQLKDFILEPGTIIVNVNADDETDAFTGAAGTPSNDTFCRYRSLLMEGQEGVAKALIDSVFSAEQTGPLALYFANGLCESSAQALGILDRLSPELAGIPFVSELKNELSRRVKTEPRTADSDFIPVYIDMEYPDAEGHPISLSSVVDNPDNRYVLLDFWATWCGPCVASLPQLKDIYEKFHDKGFEIYSVSEDPSDKRWKPFIEENGMTWINVLDTNAGRKNSKVWEDYALNGIPTVLLIDGNTGEILERGNHLDLDTILSNLLQ